jgi:putative oxidoreductase
MTPFHRRQQLLNHVLQLAYPAFPSGQCGIALLILRTFVGAALVVHGAGKLQGVQDFAQEFGISLALAYAAAWTQLLAGALLVLGLISPIASLLLMSTMLVATIELWARHEPWINPHGHSYEAASFYVVGTIVTLALGPGAYSVDRLLLAKWRHARKEF